MTSLTAPLIECLVAYLVLILEKGGCERERLLFMASSATIYGSPWFQLTVLG